ncbi:MAG: DUF4213 domain-containing protein [Anaerovoracaceae bacterium]|nr:DUF4213 domain-containing protein [Bacillota bacterium]MDD7734378.1 DUF4213 domain-containing protein [Bacillota bacterium]MDY5905665.1 DUF4213 domain-containing protein [Anaerovoracaceae bacterium]
MWTFYDRLISSIDNDNITIKDFVVGAEWCIVIADDGTAGLAPVRTEHWRRFEFGVDIKPGMPLSEAAAAVKSWNPHEASLGLAAVNAFFNRESNVTAGAVEYPGGRRSRGVFMQFCEHNTKGRRTVMIEPHYDREELANAPGLIDIVRIGTTYRDYRFNAWEDLIPQADGIVLSGEAIADKLAGTTVRAASELGRDIYFWGPDIPLAQALADVPRASGSSAAVQATGFIVDDAEKCLWTVKRAGNRDEILRLGHFVTEDL